MRHMGYWAGKGLERPLRWAIWAYALNEVWKLLFTAIVIGFLVYAFLAR